MNTIVVDPALRFANLPRLQYGPRLLVVHFTAGENPAKTVYNTLVSRGLSVHFHIGSDGTITQYADLDRRCAHASAVNAYSIGVEMTNKGLAPEDPHHPRSSYVDYARGAKHTFLDFLPAQYDALAALADHVTEQCPTIARKLPIVDGKAVSRTSISDYSLFSGVVGHCHVPSMSGKVDPGPRILDALARHWNLIGAPS